MSTVVAPLPSGSGVAAIAEHRPRRESDAHQQAEDESRSEDADGGERREQRSARHQDAPLPVAEEPAVPPETLFAAALLANDLGRLPPSPDEMRLRSSQGWSPPDSPLKLKDKLI